MANNEPNTSIALDSDFIDLDEYDRLVAEYAAGVYLLGEDASADEYAARMLTEAKSTTAAVIKEQQQKAIAPDPLAAMKRFNQWIVWREEPNPNKPDGKPIKEPKNPATGFRANALNPLIWVSYADAVAAADRLSKRSSRPFRVGFTFTADTKLFFFDLDNCIDPDTGVISSEASELIAMFPGCMVERSVSGKGLHVVGTYEGDEPAHDCRADGGLELYTNKRFMALGQDEGRAGDAGMKATVELNKLIDMHFKPSAADTVADGPVIPAEWTTEYDPAWNGFEDIDEQLRKALSSQRSINRLMAGKSSFVELHAGKDFGYDNDDSRADAAYFLDLAFWFGGNCDVMESVALASPRKRDKWECQVYATGDTWLRRDIKAAVAKHRREGRDYYRKDYNSNVEVIAVEDLNNRDVKKYDPKEKAPKYSITPFPGIMQSVVEETLRIANKPQPELTILSTLIGMAAGINGSYKTAGGARFNLYGVGISETGTGKEKARTPCEEVGRAAHSIISGQPGSGAALEDMLLEQNTKILLAVDEVAHFIASMNDSKQSHMASLSSNILRLFSASQGTYFTRALASSSNVQQRKCVNPCVSLMGFACPEKLGEVLGKSGNVEDGLLGRVLFARGLKRVQTRRGTGEFMLPTGVYDTAELIHSRMGTETVVSIDTHADLMLDEVLRSFDAASANATNGFEGALKARSYEKCERIAGVLAIWDDPLNPVINEHHVQWAESMVRYSNKIILGFTDEHMHAGQVQADAASIIRVMEKIASREVKSSNVRQKELVDKGFIPKSLALKYSRLSSRDFDIAISHLCALEQIEDIKIDDKAKGIQVLCFL